MLGWRGTFPSSSTSRTIKSEETAPGLRASLWFGKRAGSRGEGVSRTHQLVTQVRWWLCEVIGPRSPTEPQVQSAWTKQDRAATGFGGGGGVGWTLLSRSYAKVMCLAMARTQPALSPPPALAETPERRPRCRPLRRLRPWPLQHPPLGWCSGLDPGRPRALARAGLQQGQALLGQGVRGAALERNGKNHTDTVPHT